MKNLFTALLLMSAAVSAMILAASCNKNNGGGPEPEPVAPAAPVITDLSDQLTEEERPVTLKVSILASEGEKAEVTIRGIDDNFSENAEIPVGKDTPLQWTSLQPACSYEITATAFRGDMSAESSLILTTAEPAEDEGEYLSIVEVTSSSYSFRVRSDSPDGFYFSSGEYAALDYLLPGWSTSDQESLAELLIMLYPFEGSGDTVIECVDGETPEWAEIPVEVWSGTKYFVMAADKDASGNLTGDVAFLEFTTPE